MHTLSGNIYKKVKITITASANVPNPPSVTWSPVNTSLIEHYPLQKGTCASAVTYSIQVAKSWVTGIHAVNSVRYVVYSSSWVEIVHTWTTVLLREVTTEAILILHSASGLLGKTLYGPFQGRSILVELYVYGMDLPVPPRKTLVFIGDELSVKLKNSFIRSVCSLRGALA